MTFEEFQSKQSLFRAMGRANFAHADELGRFWTREREDFAHGAAYVN